MRFVLLVLALGGVCVVLGLASLVFIRVYSEWRVQDPVLVRPYAVVVVSIGPRLNRAGLVDSVRSFADENEFSFDMPIYDGNPYATATMFLTKGDVSIDVSKTNDLDRFSASFFIKPPAVGDPGLADEFATVIRRRFPDGVTKRD